MRPVGIESSSSRVRTWALDVAVHIDDRRGAGHRHRFLERADTHLRVDRRREFAGELDGFPF